MDGASELRVSDENARDFIDRLLSDPAFYDRLTNDPRSALEEAQITVPPELVPDQVTLPETEELAEWREAAESGSPFGAETTAGFIGDLLRLFFWFFHSRT